MIIYLYKKTHKITGLQYLGKTAKDPIRYLGSGINWKSHLRKYGKEIHTEIVRECYSNEEVSFWGRYYSEIWDVANSAAWANIIPETGGSVAGRKRSPSAIQTTAMKNKGKKRTDEFKAGRIGSLNSFFNKKHSDETIEKMKANHNNVSGKNNPMYGKPHPNRGKTGLWKWKNPVPKIICEHCDRAIGGKSNFNRFHGDNCKNRHV
jgi:hypothetical protein